MSFKLSTTAGALRELLDSVAGVVRRNNGVPVLNNVLMVSHEGKVALTGTNLEVEITATAEIGSYQGNIHTTVEAKKLQSILQTIPDSEAVTLTEMSNGRVQLAGHSGRFVFTTLPHADFPLIAKPDIFPNTIKAKQGKLKALLDRLGFAMAANETRYYLNGMHFRLSSNTLVAVATNGHHLASDELELESSTDEDISVILPRFTVLDLKRHLAHSDALVSLAFTTNQMRAEFGHVTYVSKLVEGKFPDHRVIARPDTACASIGRGALLLACQRVQILSAEKLAGVLMSLDRDLGGTMLRIVTQNESNEEADVTIPLDYEGPSLSIGVNVNYLVDALSALNDESITMQLSAAGGVAVFKSPSLQQFEYLLMPMRI